MGKTNLKEISKTSLAGFLQEQIVRKVNQESWKEPDPYERPLMKIKRGKVNKDSVWWWSFFRNSVEQLLP